MTDVFGEKLDLSFLSIDEQAIMDLKLYQILELRDRSISIDWDRIPPAEIVRVESQVDEFKSMLQKAIGNIDFFFELCEKAKSRLIAETESLVKEETILEQTKDFPGTNVLYKTILNFKTPDRVYALMQSKVLKNREVNRSLASAASQDPNRVFTYQELELMDLGAASLALHNAFIKVSDVLAGQNRPDFYSEEFCIVQQYPNELRAIFVSIGNRNRKTANLNSVKYLLGRNNIFFDYKSEANLDAEITIQFNCGSVNGHPVKIAVKVPYFLRSYAILNTND